MNGHRTIKCGVCIVSAVLALGACTTLDPYTGEEKVSNASKGAAIGAASGVAIGLITGDDSSERKKRALILGGVGAIAGGAVGNYMDQQELALRKKLEGTGVSVTRIGENITLNMPGNVTFASDSADVNAGFYAVLESVSLVLQEFDKTFIEVAGHTDSRGSEQYNQALSERRAGSVAAYLQSHGIRADRLVTIGSGETRPVADNNTDAGRAQNRRVELTIVPVTQ
jgi:outer membrane protein OmpA-like peptidoglycan-associated protein